MLNSRSIHASLLGICAGVLLSAWNVPYADAHSTARPKPAMSASVVLSGTADELVINDRVDGITIRYPTLQTDRGEVLLLQNTDVKTLPAGARATIVARAAERDASAAVVESVTSVTKDRAAATVAPLMFHSGDLRLAHADNFDGGSSE